MTTASDPRTRALRALLAAGAFALAGGQALAANHVFSTGPSAFCHVTDGAFTDCDPGGGVEEWSDISFLAGVGTSAGAVVYTDQSLAPPRLLLMYDLTQHTVPLAPGSFFDITFHVLEDGELEVYQVQCFGDGTFRVFEDGQDITAEADTVDCAVGFDGRNVQVELEMDTLVTYSPDIPLFWSTAAPPPRRQCPPEDPNCEPPCPPNDPRCECPPELPNCVPGNFAAALVDGPLPTDGHVITSNTIVVASSDGTTQVVGLPTEGVSARQLCDKAAGGGLLVDLVRLFAQNKSPRNHGQFVMTASQAARDAVASLVGLAVISDAEAEGLHGCVVAVLARSNAGKK